MRPPPLPPFITVSALCPPIPIEHVIPPSALPLDLLVPLLRSILYRLNELLALVSTLEWRCRSGSVLVVYEGDEAGLRAAFERNGTREGDERLPASDSTVYREGMKDGEEEEDNEEEDKEGEDDTGDESSEEGSTTSSGSPHPNSLRVFDIRLIDFAHASSDGKGSGIDQGFVLGIQSLIDVVELLLMETAQVIG